MIILRGMGFPDRLFSALRAISRLNSIKDFWISMAVCTTKPRTNTPEGSCGYRWA
jgi:hypothetical protein